MDPTLLGLLLIGLPVAVGLVAAATWFQQAAAEAEARDAERWRQRAPPTPAAPPPVGNSHFAPPPSTAAPKPRFTGRVERTIPTFRVLAGLQVPLRLTYAGGSEPGAARPVTLHGVRMLPTSAEGLLFYLDAHCHMRDGARAFRLDRIVTLVDGRTGEIVTGPGGMARWMADLLTAATPASLVRDTDPETAMRAIVDVLVMALRRGAGGHG